MTTGLTEAIWDISDAQKTAVINKELKTSGNTTILQETRLTSAGSLKRKVLHILLVRKKSWRSKVVWCTLCCTEHTNRNIEATSGISRETFNSPAAYFWILHTALVHHRISKMNDNGKRLLELCSYNILCIKNTFSSWNQSMKCHGDTQDLNTGSNWTKSLQEQKTLRMPY